MKEIELEILRYNYWEHFKFAKDISLILPLNHPRRRIVEKELNILITRINELSNDDKK